MKILLVTWDGAGNFPPERALVRGLIARGHSVHVLAHDTLRSQVKDDGAEFEPLRGVFQWNSGAPLPGRVPPSTRARSSTTTCRWVSRRRNLLAGVGKFPRTRSGMRLLVTVPNSTMYGGLVPKRLTASVPWREGIPKEELRC